MQIGIKISAATWNDARVLPEYHLAKSMKRWLNQYGHETGIQIQPEWYSTDQNHELTIVLRGQKRYTRRKERFCCLWNVSGVELRDDEIAELDCVFNCGKTLMDAAPWALLPHGVDHEIFFPDPDPITHKAIYIGDCPKTSVAHEIGQLINIDIYGENWEGTASEQFLQGHNLSHNLLRKHFSGAEVVICENTPELLRIGAIPAQVFQAAACGAKIITNRIKALDIFQSNVLGFDRVQDIPALLEKQINRENLIRLVQPHSLEARCRTILAFLDSLY